MNPCLSIGAAPAIRSKTLERVKRARRSPAPGSAAA